MSIFNLRITIRYAFFMRVICISISYMFLFVAIQLASSFSYIALIICLLPPLMKVVQRYALVEEQFSNWDLVALAVAIFGLFFLFKGNSKFTNNYFESFDNMRAFIYGVLALFFWSVGNVILQKQKCYVNHHVDTFYVGLVTTLVVPACILVFFSMHQTMLSYEWIQFLYFIVAGFLWWLFHSQFTQVMEQDTKNLYLPAIYIYLVMTVIVDVIMNQQLLDDYQLIACALIIGPNITLIVLRGFKMIKT